MKRTSKGMLLLILGFYLAVIFPILSLLLNKVYYLHYTPTNPLTYWIEWLKIYGLFTIVFAALGVYLIIISFRYFGKTKFTKIKSISIA